MQLNKSALSLQLLCESNDLCGSDLAPMAISIFLVDGNIENKQIAQNSVPTLQLAERNCDSMPIEECASVDFLPENVLNQSHKIVIDLSFDEAKWIFINPMLFPYLVSIFCQGSRTNQDSPFSFHHKKHKNPTMFLVREKLRML